MQMSTQGNLSFGNKIADRAGSWGLIISFVVIIMLWIIINVTKVRVLNALIFSF